MGTSPGAVSRSLGGSPGCTGAGRGRLCGRDVCEGRTRVRQSKGGEENVVLRRYGAS